MCGGGGRVEKSISLLYTGEEGNIDPFAEASPDSTSPRKDNVEKKAGKKNTFPAEYMNELLQVNKWEEG